MTLIRFLTVFLFLTVFPAAPVWSDVDMGLLKKGVVKVTTQFANGQKVGTGFIAGQGKKHLFIVTASHVIEGEVEVPQSIHVTFFTHQAISLVTMDRNLRPLPCFKLAGKMQSFGTPYILLY